MHPLGYSWLAASATAPMVAVLAIWTIYIFHSYRRRWRTVDLFLLAAAVQELVTAGFAFAFALLNLLGPRLGEAPCGFVLWGLTSTRTFQVATLTSLLVDRALTVRWPYRYRLSVRRNQIRYHIAVLAVTSLFVGIAAVFARLQHVVVAPPGTPELLLPTPPDSTCSLHPLGWDLKFSIFVLCLYGVLSITAIACWLDVESRRCRQPTVMEPGPYAVPLPESRAPQHPSQVPCSGTGSVSSTSSGSTRLLYSRQRSAESRAALLDFRWTPVAAVSVACFAINHFPYLVLTLLGTVAPSLWSPWYENGLLWLRLLEGLLLPLLLYLTDQPHREGLHRIWAKGDSKAVGHNGKHKVDEGRFSPLFRGGPDALPPYTSSLQVVLPPYSPGGGGPALQGKPGGPFGSLTPVGIITNYRRSTREPQTNKTRSWIPSWHSYAMPNVYGDAARGRYLSSLHTAASYFHQDDGTIKKKKDQEEEFDDSLSADTLDWKDEDHIYATLSEAGGDDVSFQSTLADESALMAEDLYGGSFTTVANDDFEFHDTRPCGGEVRMRPCGPPPPPPPPPPPMRQYEYSIRQDLSDLSMVQEEDDKESTGSSSIHELVIRVDRSPSDSSSPSKTDSGIARESNVDDEDDCLRVYRLDHDTLRRQLGGDGGSSRRSTSFSMNDLDLLGGIPARDRHQKDSDPESDDPMYVYPVKTESLASVQSGSVSPPPSHSSCGVGSYRAQSEGHLDWSGIGALWDPSRRRRRSTLLADVMHYSRARHHLNKSKKYRVSSQSSTTSSGKSSRRPVSLNGIQRIGSDVRYRSGSNYRAPASVAGYPTELPHPLNANFRLRNPKGFSDNFGYYPSLVEARHHHPHPHHLTRRCVVSGFV